MIRYFSSMTLLLCIVSGAAVWAEPSLGPAPNQAGDLQLLIVASDTTGFISDWISTDPTVPVEIRRTHVAMPDKPLFTAFLVSGYTADSLGHYECLVSFVLLDPNGREVFGQEPYATARGKMHSKPAWVMADPALDIVLEHSDMAGSYSLKGHVLDLVSGKSSDASYKIHFNVSE